jgi:hypothetical protein
MGRVIQRDSKKATAATTRDTTTELARSREKRVDVLREREEDRESNWTKVAIGSDTSEVEDVSISHRWT